MQDMNSKSHLSVSAIKTIQSILLVMIVGVSLIFSVAEVNAQNRTKSKTKKSIQQKQEKSRKNVAKRKEQEKDREVAIVSNGITYKINKDKDLKRFDQPAEAQERYLEKRLPKGMKDLPVERYFDALEEIKSMKRYSTADGKMYPSEKDAPGLKEGTAGQKPNSDGKSGEPDSVGSTSGVLGTWTNLGPGNVGGRTRALLIDPGNANIMYAGATAGGIWKSTNGGASWVALDDFLANIAVNSMAFDPANSNIIYAGTGEGFFNGGAVRGAGIFKSTDAGATWTRLASTTGADFFFVQDIVVSNVNSQRVYAATQTGVHRSLDGGASWTNVLVSNATNGLNGAMDLVIRTDQTTDYIFAAVGTFAQSHIFRNTDAGGAGVWTDVYTEAQMGRTTLALAPSNQSIIYAMFTCNSCPAGTNPTFPNVDYSQGLLAVIRSTANGDSASWSDRIRNTSSTDLQSTLLLTNPLFATFTQCSGSGSQFFTQGWYDNVIAVDPTDPNIVWTAGIDVFRSDNGGTNWGVASFWWKQNNGTPPANGDATTVHADNHIIVFQPGYDGTTNQTMFIGNDGGIFKTTNAKAGNVGYATGTTAGGGPITAASAVCGNVPVANSVTWAPSNAGYQVTQFYHGLPYPNGTTFFGGTQDNGTNRGTIGGGTNGWERIFGGDGGYVAVNPANTQQIYFETTGLSIRRSDNGGVSSIPKTTGISGDVFPFITVFQMDPTTPTRLWIGGRRMWRTDNSGDSWTVAINANLTGGSITAMAISPTNPNRVIGGAASGLMRFTTVGTTATPTTAWSAGIFTPRGNGNGTISWLAFDPTNELNVYATVSTFNVAPNANGTGVGHVFKSSDGGATWTLIDGTQTVGNLNAIPDIPAHSIIVDPNNSMRLYVGTDLGVFVSIDGGANWARETTGFSNVVTESLSIQSNNGVSSIYAFTYGRSAFKVTIPASCVTVTPAMQTLTSQSQTGSVTVTKNGGATAPCDWNSVSNANFITLNSVSLAGTDSGTLNFTLAQNNTGAMRNGTITVAGAVITVNQLAAPTAANVSVAGRLLTAGGSGIRNAIVTLTDTQGNIRTARTNSFGYYRFVDVGVGATYTLTPNSKAYTFDPASRLLNVEEDVAGIDFTGNPNR